MAHVAVTIIVLVFVSLWYTGRRINSKPKGKQVGEPPLLSVGVYAGLLGLGVVLALLLNQ